jgi:hypothetical protein
MIAKISHGNIFVGLAKYLMGQGKSNEHIDQQIIYSNNLIINNNQSLNFAYQMKLKADMKQGRKVKSSVFHCSLSIPRGEALDKQTWGDVINDYMADMGLKNNQYVAIYHGLNNNQNQHIHIMANKVNEDNKTIWDNKNDRYKANKICKKLEAKYNLTVENHSKSDVVKYKKAHKEAEENINTFETQEMELIKNKDYYQSLENDFNKNKSEFINKYKNGSYKDLKTQIDNTYTKFARATKLKSIIPKELKAFINFYLTMQKMNINSLRQERAEKQMLDIKHPVRKRSPKTVNFEQVQKWKGEQKKAKIVKEQQKAREKLKAQQIAQNKAREERIRAEKVRWDSLTPEQQKSKIQAKNERKKAIQKKQHTSLAHRSKIPPNTTNNNRGMHM